MPEMTDDEWKRFLDTKPFYPSKRGYDPNTRKTEVICRACGHLYTTQREFSKAKKEAGGDEWKRINKDSNTYYTIHKQNCDGEASEPQRPSHCTFHLSEPIHTWTAGKVTEYLREMPGDPPELCCITQRDQPLVGCPTYCCVFKHPATGIASDRLWISSTLLQAVPEYTDKVKAYLDKVEEARLEAEACRFVQRAVKRAIWTVEMETEHTRKPTRYLMNAIPSDAFKRETRQQDALYVYREMMFAFKDHPGMPITITQERMASLLEATFYGPPRLEPMRWKWSGESFGDVGVRATLLYKPHALHSFLLLCQQTGGRIRLVVDDKPSDAIRKDIYGFTHRPLPLRFQPSGKEGVVCAVLCHEEVDPLMVHDRSLVIPIAVLEGDKL